MKWNVSLGRGDMDAFQRRWVSCFALLSLLLATAGCSSSNGKEAMADGLKNTSFCDPIFKSISFKVTNRKFNQIHLTTFLHFLGCVNECTFSVEVEDAEVRSTCKMYHGAANTTLAIDELIFCPDAIFSNIVNFTTPNLSSFKVCIAEVDISYKLENSFTFILSPQFFKPLANGALGTFKCCEQDKSGLYECVTNSKETSKDVHSLLIERGFDGCSPFVQTYSSPQKDEAQCRLHNISMHNVVRVSMLYCLRKRLQITMPLDQPAIFVIKEKDDMCTEGKASNEDMTSITCTSSFRAYFFYQIYSLKYQWNFAASTNCASRVRQTENEEQRFETHNRSRASIDTSGLVTLTTDITFESTELLTFHVTPYVLCKLVIKSEDHEQSVYIPNTYAPSSKLPLEENKIGVKASAIRCRCETCHVVYEFARATPHDISISCHYNFSTPSSIGKSLIDKLAVSLNCRWLLERASLDKKEDHLLNYHSSFRPLKTLWAKSEGKTLMTHMNGQLSMMTYRSMKGRVVCAGVWPNKDINYGLYPAVMGLSKPLTFL